MDSLHAIGFYASSGVSLVGGLGVALLQRRDRRGAALAATAIGVAGIYISLSAGFAALIALICYLGCALVIGGAYRAIVPVVEPWWRQLGAIAAAALFAVLAYSAFKGDFATAKFYGGTFNTAAIGRLVFAHDALPAAAAIAALVLVALAGSTAVWRIRERAR